jgi:nicotinic acid mononucleotide adenylyltransferase
LISQSRGLGDVYKRQINGSLAITELLENAIPDLDEVRIYWTPTSKNQDDGFIKEECVSEKERIEMLELLRKEFNKYSPKKTSIIINDTGMKTGLPLLLVDNIQVMINKYDIFKSSNEDHVYAVLSQYIVENALDRLIDFSDEILSQYNLLVYPNEEVVANNKAMADQLINNFKKMAGARGVGVLNMHIIPQTVPTNEALIVRSAAKIADKKTILKYVPPTIANYIIRRKIYTDPHCNILKGGRRSRKRKTGILKKSTRRR